MGSDLEALVSALEKQTPREVAINPDLKRRLMRYRKNRGKPLNCDCGGKIIEALRQIKNGIY